MRGVVGVRGGGQMEPTYTALFRYVSMGLGLVALGYPGRVFFRGGWAALRTRTPHLDAPIALGLLAGGLAGVINTLRGRGETYFDSLTVLVFLLLVGRFLQQRQQRRADDAVEALYCLTPGAARRIEQDPGAAQETGGPGGLIDPGKSGTDALVGSPAWPAGHDADERTTVRTVPIEALAVGDLVEVRAGESIPVDAVVVPGGKARDEGWGSSVDQGLLTGESRPVRVEPGAAVFAGTLNLAATLRMRVTAAGAATRVGKLMALVAQGARNKAPMVLLADRLSGYFLTMVMVLAAATLSYWLWRGSPLAADHTVALLIVACPCALGLATPLAMGVALGRAARRGILIKGGAALEHLAARHGTIYLDKTGTLTMGQTALVTWESQAHPTAGVPPTPALRPPRNVGVGGAPAVDFTATSNSLLQTRISALEQQSSHPIAQAFCRALADVPRPVETIRIEAVRQDARGGITGRVGDRELVIGSPQFVERQVGTLPGWAQAAVERVLERVLTPVLVAQDGLVVGVAGFGDPLRPEARSIVELLQRRSWRVAVLSGDHPDLVARIAADLGISDARGGLLPEDKLALLREQMQRRSGPVVMVGDGVNDAAALAAATVGIAVHGGAEASLAAADIYLGHPGLAAIGDLLTAAQRTVGAIRWSLACALAYNPLAVALATAGWINPLVAAILMPLSSLTVISVALAARTFGDRPCP